MAQTPDFTTGLFLADTLSAAGTVTLPFASQLQGRIITIKDATQSFGIHPLYVETSVGDTFQDGTTTITLDITNSYLTLVAYGTTWYTIGDFQSILNSTITASSIQVSSVTTNLVNLSNAAPLTFTPVANDFSWVNSLLYTSSTWLAAGVTSGTPLGSVQTSSNGLAWVPQITGLSEGYAVAYNGSNLYAAVGYTDGTSNSTINTSPDAITWTPRLTTLTRVRAVAHNQYNRWMVGGYTDGTSNGVVQTSTDGTTWTTLPIPAMTDVYGLNINEGIWIAVGHTDGTSNGTLQTSTDDGQTWISRSVPFTTGYSVGYNGNSQWVALGYTDGTSNGTLLTSSNAETWTAQTNAFTSSFGSVVYGGGQWVAVGNAGDSTSASIQTSYNGTTWVPVSNLLTEGYAVGYNGSNQWVVGGYTDGTTQGTLQTSITNSGLVFSNTNLYFLNNKVLLNQNGVDDSVAIGTRSGTAHQSTQSVAVGFAAGELRQQEKSVAIGANAGQNDQSKNSIAIGAYAGQTAQGSYAVAIGSFAGQSFQGDHSIVLNASASTINTSNSGFFVAPIRELNSTGSIFLGYNPVSKEVLATTAPQFESLNASSISTYNMTVYGPQTLTVQGLANITQLRASSLALGADYSPLTLSSGYLYAGASPISTVGGGGGSGDVTTGNLVSTVEGLAEVGYISTASLVSTVESLTTGALINQANLVSTTAGLGESGYISSLSTITAYSLTVTNTADINTLTASTISTGAMNMLDYPGYSWTSLTATGRQPWVGLAVNSNATTIVAGSVPGYIYKSEDSGASWTTLTSAGSNSWVSLTMTPNGSILFAGTDGSGPFKVSSDGGTTWADRTPAGRVGTLFYASACSSNGSVVYLTDYQGYVYKSTDLGSNWTTITDLGSNNWFSVACSADGTRVYVGGLATPLYRSEDSGATWVQAIGPANWYSITSSTDGLKVATVYLSQYVYTSRDGGSNWTAQEAGGARNWVSIASSSNGEILVASVENSVLFTSLDFGVSWTPASVGGSTWRIVGASQDGSRLAGADFGYYNGGGYVTLGNKTTLYSALTLSSGYMFVNSSNLKTNADLTILSSIAGIGELGYLSSSKISIGIGQDAGRLATNGYTVAIGVNAGYSNQGISGVAIGSNTGAYSQETACLAIGPNAGYSNQGEYSVALGFGAGYITQGTNTTAVGREAGALSQGANAVAIGWQASYFSQGPNAVSVGYQAGHLLQSTCAVAVGIQAGFSNQDDNAIAIGKLSAYNAQSTNAIAIGNEAGYTNQGHNTIALGYQSGYNSQQAYAVAIGWNAGNITQGERAVTIGVNSGVNQQGSDSVAIGHTAGHALQGSNAVAIGFQAGHTSQGSNAVAIGNMAGCNTQPANSIVLNASESAFQAVASGFFVNPVRLIDDTTPLTFNFITGEIGYTSSLTVSTITSPSLFSTFDGLGDLGYISTASLLSTTNGLGSLGYLSSGAQGPAGLFMTQLSTFSGEASISTPTSYLVSTINDTVGIEQTFNLAANGIFSETLLPEIKPGGAIDFGISSLTTGSFVTRGRLAYLTEPPNLYLYSNDTILSTIAFSTGTALAMVLDGAQAKYVVNGELAAQYPLTGTASEQFRMITNVSTMIYPSLPLTIASYSNPDIYTFSFIHPANNELQVVSFELDPTTLVPGKVTVFNFYYPSSNYIPDQIVAAPTLASEVGLSNTSSYRVVMYFYTSGIVNADPIGTQRVFNLKYWDPVNNSIDYNSITFTRIHYTPTSTSYVPRSLTYPMGSLVNPSEIVISTVGGLGDSGYISTTGLISTVEGLGDSGYISTAGLISTVEGLGDSGYISTTALISTVEGLGDSGYVSTIGLISTVEGLGDSGYISTIGLISTVEGLGTSGYVSTNTARANIVQATLPTHQTITNGIDTVIQFTDDIDPNNWWDASTYKFQPSINGYYLVNVQVWWQQGVLNGTNQTNIQIRKNGTSLAITQSPVVSSMGNSQTLSKLFQMNGTTDYLDVTAFTGNTTSQVINGGVNGTYFYATLQ